MRRATSGTPKVFAVRETIGPDVTLMVDVGYRWDDADTCLATIQDWAEFDCFFLETPVWSDNLERDRPVAAGARCRSRTANGLPPALSSRIDGDRRSDRTARRRPRRRHRRGQNRLRHGERERPTIVPHCWKTGVSISATAHLAFVAATAPSSSTCRPSSATSGYGESWPTRSWSCGPTAPSSSAQARTGSRTRLGHRPPLPGRVAMTGARERWLAFAAVAVVPRSPSSPDPHLPGAVAVPG